MINLIVWDPTQGFIKHLEKNKIRYRRFTKSTPKGDPRIEINNYPFGTYNKMIGLAAARKINKKWGTLV